MGITVAYFKGKKWSKKELNALACCELIFGDEHDNSEYDYKYDSYF